MAFMGQDDRLFQKDGIYRPFPLQQQQQRSKETGARTTDDKEAYEIIIMNQSHYEKLRRYAKDPLIRAIRNAFKSAVLHGPVNFVTPESKSGKTEVPISLSRNDEILDKWLYKLNNTLLPDALDSCFLYDFVVVYINPAELQARVIDLSRVVIWGRRSFANPDEPKYIARMKGSISANDPSDWYNEDENNYLHVFTRNGFDWTDGSITTPLASVLYDLNAINNMRVCDGTNYVENTQTIVLIEQKHQDGMFNAAAMGQVRHTMDDSIPGVMPSARQQMLIREEDRRMTTDTNRQAANAVRRTMQDTPLVPAELCDAAIFRNTSGPGGAGVGYSAVDTLTAGTQAVYRPQKQHDREFVSKIMLYTQRVIAPFDVVLLPLAETHGNSPEMWEAAIETKQEAGMPYFIFLKEIMRVISHIFFRQRDTIERSDDAVAILSCLAKKYHHTDEIVMQPSTGTTVRKTLMLFNNGLYTHEALKHTLELAGIGSHTDFEARDPRIYLEEGPGHNGSLDSHKPVSKKIKSSRFYETTDRNGPAS